MSESGCPGLKDLQDKNRDLTPNAYEEAWSNLSNGDLLKAAENKGYQILVTTDQNLRYQQNLSERQIAIVVLLSTSWPKIRKQVDQVCSIINTIELGDYQEISII
ncbi:MAG: hypothetical protein ACLBM4_05865 [Dolichospermum sp.]